MSVDYDDERLLLLDACTPATRAALNRATMRATIRLVVSATRARRTVRIIGRERIETIVFSERDRLIVRAFSLRAD